MDPQLQSWLLDNDYGQIVRSEGISGGSINETGRLYLDRGKSLFIKRQDHAPEDMFSAEAAGLQALQAATTLRIPDVIYIGQDFLVLEDLGDGPRGKHFHTDLASGLAQLHQSRQEQFGFVMDNYCGATRQLNTPCSDGFEFFAERRLLHLGRKAYDAGLLPREICKRLEFLAANLSRWIPAQPPVVLHGDLWSGNVHCDERGQPCLVDPACYWGWAEADLAMTLLFGGFSTDFYANYAEISDLDSNWRERVPLYNLYHLLNHLLLFGSGYLPGIESTCREFAG